MSRTALWITVTLGLSLGLLALVLTLTNRVSFDVEAPLLVFDPVRVALLRIEEPGTPPVEFRRDRGESWTMAARVEGGASWPAASARVRAALRMLADAHPLEGDAAGDGDAHDAEITVGVHDGQSLRLRLSRLPLGGRVVARVGDGAPVLIDGAIADALTIDSALSWRDTSALPGVTGDASRVRIAGGDGAVALGKTLGVWTMREPANARANQAAVGTLLDALSRLSVSRFVDTPGAADAASAGVLQPRWRIDIEHDVRTLGEDDEVRVRTVARRIAIGAAADVEGDTAYATADDGRTLMIVRIDSLRDVAPDPLAFIARNATDITADNVGMVIIVYADGREEGYRSGLDGWRSLRPDGAMGEAPDDAVRELLDFVSLRIAPVIEIGASETFLPAASVRLFGFTDDPLDTLEFGSHPDHPGAPAVRSGDAVRIFTGSTTPALLGG